MKRQESYQRFMLGHPWFVNILLSCCENWNRLDLVLLASSIEQSLQDNGETETTSSMDELRPVGGNSACLSIAQDLPQSPKYKLNLSLNLHRTLILFGLNTIPSITSTKSQKLLPPLAMVMISKQIFWIIEHSTPKLKLENSNPYYTQTAQPQMLSKQGQ